MVLNKLKTKKSMKGGIPSWLNKIKPNNMRKLSKKRANEMKEETERGLMGQENKSTYNNITNKNGNTTLPNNTTNNNTTTSQKKPRLTTEYKKHKALFAEDDHPNTNNINNELDKLCKLEDKYRNVYSQVARTNTSEKRRSKDKTVHQIYTTELGGILYSYKIFGTLRQRARQIEINNTEKIIKKFNNILKEQNNNINTYYNIGIINKLPNVINQHNTIDLLKMFKYFVELNRIMLNCTNKCFVMTRQYKGTLNEILIEDLLSNNLSSLINIFKQVCAILFVSNHYLKINFDIYFDKDIDNIGIIRNVLYSEDEDTNEINTSSLNLLKYGKLDFNYGNGINIHLLNHTHARKLDNTTIKHFGNNLKNVIKNLKQLKTNTKNKIKIDIFMFIASFLYLTMTINYKLKSKNISSVDKDLASILNKIIIDFMSNKKLSRKNELAPRFDAYLIMVILDNFEYIINNSKPTNFVYHNSNFPSLPSKKQPELDISNNKTNSKTLNKSKTYVTVKDPVTGKLKIVEKNSKNAILANKTPKKLNISELVKTLKIKNSPTNKKPDEHIIMTNNKGQKFLVPKTSFNKKIKSKENKIISLFNQNGERKYVLNKGIKPYKL